jgi:hypothetical protein
VLTALGWCFVGIGSVALSALAALGATPTRRLNRSGYATGGLFAYAVFGIVGFTLVFGSFGAGLGATVLSMPLAAGGAWALSRSPDV